jgi:murein DD-endopeptidase MepM/ murein hydrolase activator NlpD
MRGNYDLQPCNFKLDGPTREPETRNPGLRKSTLAGVIATTMLGWGCWTVLADQSATANTEEYSIIATMLGSMMDLSAIKDTVKELSPPGVIEESQPFIKFYEAAPADYSALPRDVRDPYHLFPHAVTSHARAARKHPILKDKEGNPVWKRHGGTDFDGEVGNPIKATFGKSACADLQWTRGWGWKVDETYPCKTDLRIGEIPLWKVTHGHTATCTPRKGKEKPNGYGKPEGYENGPISLDGYDGTLTCVGLTGLRTGSHIHTEVFANGEAIDRLLYGGIITDKELFGRLGIPRYHRKECKDVREISDAGWRTLNKIEKQELCKYRVGEFAYDQYHRVDPVAFFAIVEKQIERTAAEEMYIANGWSVLKDLSPSVWAVDNLIPPRYETYMRDILVRGGSELEDTGIVTLESDTGIAIGGFDTSHY